METYSLPAGELAILALLVGIIIYASSARLSLITLAAGWEDDDKRRPNVRKQVRALNITLRSLFALAALTLLAILLRFLGWSILLPAIDMLLLFALFVLLVMFTLFHEQLNSDGL